MIDSLSPKPPRGPVLALVLFLATILTACSGGDSSENAAPSADDLTTGSLTAPLCTPLHSSLICLHFSSTTTGTYDYTIRNELVRLIEHTPANYHINGTFFALGDTDVGDALIRAHSRGVHVRLTLDGGNRTDPLTAQPRRVYAALGSANVKYCGSGTGRGCVSSDPNGIAHTKLMTFSRTTDPHGADHRYASWVSSYNALPTRGGGANASNNAVTVYDSYDSWAGYNATLNNMWSETHFAGNAYFDEAAGPSRGYFYDAIPRTEARFSPTPITTSSEGLIYDELMRVTPDSSCVLRVMHAAVADSMSRTLRRLLDLKAGGCRIYFMVSTIGTATLTTLRNAGIEVRQSCHSLHDKLLMIDAVYDNYHRKIMLTGSHNWSTTASSRNDELLARYYDDAMWGTTTTGFYGHFLDLWQATSTLEISPTRSPHQIPGCQVPAGSVAAGSMMEERDEDL